MSTSTLGLGGGGFLGIGLRQANTQIAVEDDLNTFNGLDVTFFSPYGEQVGTLTAGRGNGDRLNADMEFSKYGNLISFNLEVLRNCEIPFFNGMNVQFNFKNIAFAYGYLDIQPTTDQTDSVIKLKGSGQIKRLKDKKVTETYTSSTISDIIKDLGSTYFLDLDVDYNPGKISAPSTAVSSATWDDKSLINILDDLIKMSNTSFDTIEYIYGIDEEGDFYFKGISNTDIEDTYFEGFNYQSPETEEDASNLVNQVKLFRTTAADNKETEYVNTYSDSDSQDLYGLYEKKVTIADFIDNTSASNIANGIIADWKDPKTRITIKDLEIDNVLDFGYYNITNKRQDQREIISEFNSSTEWTETFSTATSDIISTNVLTGRLCYELSISSSQGDSLTKSVEYYMPTKMRVYIRQNFSGEYLSITVTGTKGKDINKFETNSGDQIVTNAGDDLHVVSDMSVNSSTNINVPFSNEWTYVDLDLTGWFKIDSVTFTVLTNDVATILLDRLELFDNAYFSRLLSLESVNYNFGVNSIKCNSATFGIKKLTLTEKLNTIDEKNNIPYDIFSKQ